MYLLLLIPTSIFVLYRRWPAWIWTTSTLAIFTLQGICSQFNLAMLVLSVFLIFIMFFIHFGGLRRIWFTAPLYRWFSKALPPISKTEEEAIAAGTVWWDAELFSGKPDWNKLFSATAASLTSEEQDFIDGPVKQLCTMLDEWEINQHGDLSPEVWQFVKDNGFFGMIIPKEYGGKGFSAHANSAVVMKIASKSVTCAVTVMVPNSLGPGELLEQFGTQEQKDKYLPSLANGKDVPCFALTSPWAGSDAGGIPDTGIICEREIDGKKVLGYELSWDKRYITLAPVATLLGLAFHMKDPDHLLGDKEDLGITLALVETTTQGVEIGDRHSPIGSPFMNGPTRGDKVFIPMNTIIGGQERIGHGWRMLMSCLAAGRAISLPAMATAGSQYAIFTSSAYAQLRRQFRVSVNQFEGIQEVLARMAASAYRCESARSLTLTAIDMGEKPVVLSAILKHYLTEDYRRNINGALDIHGGKGICLGPDNYLASPYQTLPVSITVEGANILTRSMIVFGQGAIRCHPWLLKEMQAAQQGGPQGLYAFDNALLQHLGFVFSNAVRAKVLAFTGGRSSLLKQAGLVGWSVRRVNRLSAAFALTSDLTLAVLGGKFKFAEFLSGRLADILSYMYLSTSALKNWMDQGQPAEQEDLVRWVMMDSFHLAEQALIDVIENFPIKFFRPLLKIALFPWGRWAKKPGDQLTHKFVKQLRQPGALRDFLGKGIHVDPKGNSPVDHLEKTFIQMHNCEASANIVRNAYRQELYPDNVDALAQKAVKSGLLEEKQAAALCEAIHNLDRVIQVNEFKPEQFKS
ncbi:MAG: acyl-CoA dehydrogenase [bacterium]